MKTTKITSISELRSERSRLNLKLQVLDEEIRDNYTSLKISLHPGNIVKSLFNSRLDDTSSSPVSDKVSTVGGSVLNFLISGILMKKSGIIKRLVASSVIQKFAPFLIKQGVPLISSFISKMREKSHKKHQSQAFYDSTTAYDFNSK